MDKHLVILGWGYNSERVIFETYQRYEAIEAYEESYAEWMEEFAEDPDTEEARSARPYHVVDCGYGNLLEYYY
jgi:hypothetical protein